MVFTLLQQFVRVRYLLIVNFILFDLKLSAELTI